MSDSLSPPLWLLSVSSFVRTDISHTLRIGICQEACVRELRSMLCCATLLSHLSCLLAVGDMSFVSPGDKAINHIRCLPQARHAALATRCLNLSVPGCNSRYSSLEWNGRLPSLVLGVCVCVLNIFLWSYTVCKICKMIWMDEVSFRQRSTDKWKCSSFIERDVRWKSRQEKTQGFNILHRSLAGLYSLSLLFKVIINVYYVLMEILRCCWKLQESFCLSCTAEH